MLAKGLRSVRLVPIAPQACVEARNLAGMRKVPARDLAGEAALDPLEDGRNLKSE